MKKRFIDADIFLKEKFRKVPYSIKLFWFYICMRCDFAGIWENDIELAEFQLGVKIKKDDIQKYLKDKIVVLPNSKWYIKNFLIFQYGVKFSELNEENHCHKGILKIYKGYKDVDFDNIEQTSLDLVWGQVGVKIAPKDKEKDKEKDKDKEKSNIYTTSFNNFWELYPRRKGTKLGKKQCREFWDKIKEADIELILTGVKNYAESQQVKSGYAKDPIRFLQHEIWQDFQEEEESEFIRELKRRGEYEGD